MSYLISFIFSILNIYFSLYIFSKYRLDFIKKIFIISLIILFQIGVVIKTLLLFEYPKVVTDKFFFSINSDYINLKEFFYLNIICFIFYLIFIYFSQFNLSFIKKISAYAVNLIYKVPILKKKIGLNYLFIFVYTSHILLLLLSLKFGIGLHGQEYKIKLPPLIGGLIVFSKNFVIPSALVTLFNIIIFQQRKGFFKKGLIISLLFINIILTTFVETSKVMGVIVLISIFGPNLFIYFNSVFKNIYIFSKSFLFRLSFLITSLFVTLNATLRIASIGKLFRRDSINDLEIITENNLDSNFLINIFGLFSKRLEGSRELMLIINQNISTNPFSVFFFGDQTLPIKLYPNLNYSEGNMGITYGLFGYGHLTDNLIISTMFILFMALLANFFINIIKNFHFKESSICFLSVNLIILFWGGASFNIIFKVFIAILMTGYFNKFIRLNKLNYK